MLHELGMECWIIEETLGMEVNVGFFGMEVNDGGGLNASELRMVEKINQGERLHIEDQIRG